MKKTIYGLMLLIVTALFIAGCAETEKIVENKEPIKIGFVGPFTGGASAFGMMMQNGMDLALEELPEETKNRIIIIKEDDMCLAANGLTAVKKLIEVDGVKYVIGPMCNEANIATEKSFDDNKVISISIGLPSNYIANMGEYHFSFSPEIEFLMKSINDKIKEDNVKRIAVIHMNAAFETENYDYFVKYLKENGGVIVADESAIKGTTDYRISIQKIRDSNPDAIMIIAHTGELVNILKQLEENGLGDLPKYGIHAAEAPVITLQVPNLAEGLVYPYPADKAEIDSAKSYADKYFIKYNFDADPYSSNTYDSLKILVVAIENCGYDNVECVKKDLSSITNYPGANGLLSVDARGVGTYKNIMLKVVKNGKFEKLD